MSIRENVRTKRVIIPAVAALAIVGAGGVAWAVVANDDDSLTSEQRSQAGDAAIEEVGGGRVLEVDVDDETDEGGERVYDVEVVDSAGLRWDITLDDSYTVLVADPDDDGAQGGSNGGDQGSTNGGTNGNGGSTDDSAQGGIQGDTDGTQNGSDDDAPISDTERADVTAAAEAAVDGGRVVDIDRSDDRGEAWEVEVVDGSGADWDVTLDADLQVLDARRD